MPRKGDGRLADVKWNCRLLPVAFALLMMVVKIDVLTRGCRFRIISVLNVGRRSRLRKRRRKRRRRKGRGRKRSGKRRGRRIGRTESRNETIH